MQNPFHWLRDKAPRTHYVVAVLLFVVSLPALLVLEAVYQTWRVARLLLAEVLDAGVRVFSR